MLDALTEGRAHEARRVGHYFDRATKRAFKLLRQAIKRTVVHSGTASEAQVDIAPQLLISSSKGAEQVHRLYVIACNDRSYCSRYVLTSQFHGRIVPSSSRMETPVAEAASRQPPRWSLAAPPPMATNPAALRPRPHRLPEAARRRSRAPASQLSARQGAGRPTQPWARRRACSRTAPSTPSSTATSCP